jgi:hypothetical protein
VNLLKKNIILFLAIIFVSILSFSCENSTFPEKQKSEVPFDQNYINTQKWTYASVPKQLNYQTSDQAIEWTNSKADIFWGINDPSPFIVHEINGDTSQVIRVPVLIFHFNSTNRGIYNYNKDYAASVNSWAGAVTLLEYHDIEKLNTKLDSTYLEIWIYYSPLDSNVTVNLDIGKISEDVIPNLMLDHEDINLNKKLDEGEDTGIDGLFDDEEREYFLDVKGDPSRDNFVSQTNGFYRKINRPQDNGRVDSEDINKNFALNIENHYYSYRLSLNDDNKYISEKGHTRSWSKLRIKVSDYDEKIGNPENNTLNKIRMWLKGDYGKVMFGIAELKLTK